MTRQTSHLIREGQFAAEVVISLHDDGGEWSPTVTPEDIRKLDRVRAALRSGNLALAEKDAQIFKLVPHRSVATQAAGFGENEQDGFQS